MCILFVYHARQNSSAIRLPFKLILAANRDEMYARPSKEASFWEAPNSDILGGQDLQSGGTWLGMNTVTGKLGILLNIMGGTKKEISSTRGSLITNFLRSPKHLTGWTYCKNLSQDPSLDIFHSFSQFNLVAIDLLDEQAEGVKQGESNRTFCCPPQITYFTNHSSDAPPGKASISAPEQITSNFFSLGNTPYTKPFLKTSVGLKLFEEILTSTTSPTSTTTDTVKIKDTLKMKLLDFLKSTQKYYPDPQLLKQGQGQSEDLLKGLSSIFVEKDAFQNVYGTRTHTILLVDNENNVNFHEWTLKDPSNGNFSDWMESDFSFKVPNNSVPKVNSKV